MLSLVQKQVFITGASSGIGRACAESFAAAGANLIISARRIDRLKELGERLAQKFSVSVVPIALDVRSWDQVQQTVTRVASHTDIDILLNNAGLARGLNKFHEASLQDWEEMIDTNVKGLIYVTRAVLPLMVRRQAGHIINIGSIAGREVYPSGNVYCATKSAVKVLTQALRIDTLGHNIRVTNIEPGMVNTEFSLVRFRGDKDRADKVYQGILPLTPEDVADAVVYAATRPAHVNISEMFIMPTAQASSTLVHRDNS